MCWWRRSRRPFVTRMGYRVHAREILDLRNAAVETASNVDANIGVRRWETDAEICGFEQNAAIGGVGMLL